MEPLGHGLNDDVFAVIRCRKGQSELTDSITELLANSPQVEAKKLQLFLLEAINRGQNMESTELVSDH